MMQSASARERERVGMSRLERAKQFSSFEALSEAPDYLRRAEFRPANKIELSEEAAEELNRRLIDLVPGDLISATYFSCGEYRTRRGRFIRIDLAFRRFYLDGLAFPLDDLYALSKQGE